MREEAQRARQRIANATTAKVAEQAQKALKCQEQQRLWATKAVEMAHGCQGGGSSEDAIAEEPEMPRAHIASSIP